MPAPAITMQGSRPAVSAFDASVSDTYVSPGGENGSLRSMSRCLTSVARLSRESGWPACNIDCRYPPFDQGWNVATVVDVRVAQDQTMRIAGPPRKLSIETVRFFSTPLKKATVQEDIQAAYVQAMKRFCHFVCRSVKFSMHCVVPNLRCRSRSVESAAPLLTEFNLRQLLCCFLGFKVRVRLKPEHASKHPCRKSSDGLVVRP